MEEDVLRTEMTMKARRNPIPLAAYITGGTINMVSDDSDWHLETSANDTSGPAFLGPLLKCNIWKGLSLVLR